MSSYNKVILIGNLTRDPELRVTPAGHSICKLRLAVSRSYRMQDGTQKEETTFLDVDSFGKQAEVISKHFVKGRPIFIEGRLKLEQWDDKNTGEKRSRLGVVMENFQFIGGRADSEGSSSGSSRGAGAASGGDYEDVTPPARSETVRATASSEVAARTSDIDEDVPF